MTIFEVWYCAEGDYIYLTPASKFNDNPCPYCIHLGEL